MRHLGRLGVVLLLLLFLAVLEVDAENPSLPLVMANDNNRLGVTQNGVLKLELEISQGRSYRKMKRVNIEMPMPSEGEPFPEFGPADPSSARNANPHHNSQHTHLGSQDPRVARSSRQSKRDGEPAARGNARTRTSRRRTGNLSVLGHYIRQIT